MNHAIYARRREDGFTIIELLVVMLTIGVLAGVAIPIYMQQQEKSRQTTARSDVRHAVAAVNDFLVGSPDAADLTPALAAAKVSECNTLTVTGSGADFVVTGTTKSGWRWCYKSATGQSGSDCKPPLPRCTAYFFDGKSLNSAYGKGAGYGLSHRLSGLAFDDSVPAWAVSTKLAPFGLDCLDEYKRGYYDAFHNLPMNHPKVPK